MSRQEIRPRIDERGSGGLLTNCKKTYKLTVKNNAIICPACGRKIRGIRLLPGAVLRDVSVMCQPCRRVWIVNIDEASATYESPRR